MEKAQREVIENRNRPLLSLNDLEHRLGEDRDTLRRLARSTHELYKPFERQKDPKPFQRVIGPRKVRTIDNPNEELKRVQRKILRKLLRSVELPHFLFGAVSKRCIVKHAAEHLRMGKNMPCMVKLDVKNYYPSITEAHVRNVFEELIGCTPRIASLLTTLTIYEGRLPQGAPTSPAIANLYMASIYSPVLEACNEHSVVPTAWVDDLVFSGANARRVMELVRCTLKRAGLDVAKKKRVILGPRSAKIACGVRVGRDRLRAPKPKLRDLRAAIHKLEIGAVAKPVLERYLQQTQSRIRHVASICKKDAASLQKRFDDAALVAARSGARL